MSLLDDISDALKQPTRYENYISALCPFHDDSRPSFIVYEDSYICYSCGAFGRTANLLQKLNGRVVFQKPTTFYNPFTSWLKKESLSTVLKTAAHTLRERPSQYLLERGIPVQVQHELWLGWRDGWITFPIMDQNNKLVGAVARIGLPIYVPSKYIIPKGQNPNLPYVPNWKKVESNRYVYLTFGILDAVTLYMHGQGALSTTNGKRIDYHVFDSMRKLIAVVPDKGEDSEAWEIAKNLGWRGKVIRVNYPDGCKDLNDVEMLDRTLINRGLEEINGTRLAIKQ